MSDAARTSTEYTVEYIDGPLAGRTDRRVLIRGKYDDKLSVVAAVEGLESLFRYFAVGSREVQGEWHVQYSFDAPDSDPFESDRDDE